MNKLLKWFGICIIGILGISFGVASGLKTIESKKNAACTEKLKVTFSQNIIGVDKNNEDFDILEFLKQTPNVKNINSNYYCFGGCSILDICEDLINCKWEHGYSNEFGDKELYENLIIDSIERKAAFMTLVEYFYTITIPYEAKNQGYNIKNYFINQCTGYNGNERMNDCISRCLYVLNYSGQKDISIHIEDKQTLEDIGTAIGVGYWINIGSLGDNSNLSIFSALSKDFYEKSSQLVMRMTNKYYKEYNYTIMGGPIETMLGTYGYDGISKENINSITIDQLNFMYSRWEKYFNLYLS